jgi:hypothetical protein
MSACKGGNLDVVKYVCEIGGKELVMATDEVSGFGLSAVLVYSLDWFVHVNSVCC